jgi:hypothetical protein
LNETLRIAVPRDFVHEMGLRAGDYVDWVREHDNVRLKFVKVEPPAALEAASCA